MDTDRGTLVPDAGHATDDATVVYATDDEFSAAYAIEKPRWAELAERLK